MKRRLILLALMNAGLFAQGQFTVTVFDFKTHGLAIFMQTPTGKSWLIDTALRPKDDYYGARDVIGPFLKTAGVRELDGVLISHPHGDHYGGLPYILEHFRIGQLVDAGYEEIGGNELEIYRKLRAQYVAGGGKSVIVKYGTRLPLDPDLDAEILWPPAGLSRPDPTKKDDALYNANSIVLRVRHGANVFLFPGDQHGLVNMAKTVGQEKLKCDLLIAPHHGLNSTPAMAALTRPKIVVVASLKEYLNPTIHPYELTSEAFASTGAEVCATWSRGNITIVSDGKSLQVRSPKLSQD